MATDFSVLKNTGPISSINVTPFVDVVLVLLVIFLVTAPTYMQDALGIKLPEASASRDKKVYSTVGVSVNKQGQFLFEGQMVSVEVLEEKIKQKVSTDPEARAIISADQGALHGDVVRAIDVIRTAGLSKFAIQIQKR